MEVEAATGSALASTLGASACFTWHSSIGFGLAWMQAWRCRLAFTQVTQQRHKVQSSSSPVQGQCDGSNQMEQSTEHTCLEEGWTGHGMVIRTILQYGLMFNAWPVSWTNPCIGTCVIL